MIALPVSMPDPSLPCYATLIEAAHGALTAAAVLGHNNVEAGGALYTHEGAYCFTTPVTQGLPGAVDYRVRLVAPDRLVGLYHTHPGSRSTGVEPGRLSDSDIAMSRLLKLPLFVVAVEARWVITYTPATRRETGERL
jgi:hypothetical protein